MLEVVDPLINTYTRGLYLIFLRIEESGCTNQYPTRLSLKEATDARLSISVENAYVILGILCHA